VAGKDVPVLFIYAFDRRTRLGPFVFVDKKLVPGAPIAVASALADAGFASSRVVLQQGNPHILPSQARIGGKPLQYCARSKVPARLAHGRGLQPAEPGLRS